MLDNGLVVCHPFIIGELALGSLKDRGKIIDMLKDLPRVTVAQTDEILCMVEKRRLFSRGLGLIDAHLLGSTLIERGVRLWTADKRFASIANELGIGSHPLN